ncbi:RICIN domain-containing protein [Couchioplanes azureus]|uniref:RICIN domain-containing protein n=1 Tax=Couchioplanes caeruleus TaxID=56438 RepID=UPI00167101AC|nr:RICIN domain-containing protein [Couchioplanes caeruleus]GGQ67764.1 hypothetical protein GCM10010166_42190 [Couchioplanes caeruleus subsp. azureus]
MTRLRIMFASVVAALTVLTMATPAQADRRIVTFTYANAYTGKCLDVSWANRDNFGPVNQWDCYGGTNQQFQEQWVAPDTYLLRAWHSGKCLDPRYGSTSSDVPVIQYDCHGARNQQWRRLWKQDNTFLWQNVHSGKCLEIDVIRNTGALQYDCNGGAFQKWRYERSFTY